MNNRGFQLEHTVLILKQLLETALGLSVREIAGRTSLSDRTVQRHLTILSLYFPITAEPVPDDRRRKRYRFISPDHQPSLPQVTFGMEDILALRFFSSLIPDRSGLPFHEQLERAFTKMRLALHTDVSTGINSLLDVFQCQEKVTKDYRKHRQTIGFFTESILTRRVLRVHYQSFQSGRLLTLKIEPVKLFFYDGGIYIRAYVRGFRDYWTLAVERFRQITIVEGETASTHDSSAIQSRADQSFGIYDQKPFASRFRFAAWMVPFIRERSFHPSQTLTDLPDGSIEVAFFCGGEFDLQKWALGFGSAIEVLEPERLRDSIRDELGKALAQYPPAT